MGISRDSEGETETQGARTVFLLSARDTHSSQAEKKHYANRLYAPQDAAITDLPYTRARQRVVMIRTSKSGFKRLFDHGRSLLADLRNTQDHDFMLYLNLFANLALITQ